MESIFLRIVNLSITAGWLVLAVLLVRWIFRGMPKWAACILWGLVALRLMCPISIESALSLVPSSEPIPQEFLVTATPQIHTGVSVINNAVNPILSSSMTPDPVASVNPAQVLSSILSWIWLGGMILMLLYALISWLLLRRRVATATLLQKNIKQSEQVDSPFVLGFFKPVIYLPYQISIADMAYVIAHEKAHIRRKDHWWKPVGFLLLSVYWFHPALWAAYALLCRDIEAACDEKVVHEMGPNERRAYSTALLHCSIRRRRIAACPLAFGEVSVKERVKSVMNYKKPAFWIVALAIATCIVLAVCFLTIPEQPSETSSWPKLEDIRENYSQEQAKNDGCVVIDNSDLLFGEKAWVDFVNATAAGQEATVRIYQSYSNQGDSYYVKELHYDGEKYRLRFYDRTGDTGEEFLSQQEYRYLTRSIYAPNPQTDMLVEDYLLADSPEATAEGYFSSLFSSIIRPEPDIYSHCRSIFSCTVDQEYAAQSMHGVAFYDIDGDGIEEKCCLGWGQTSGLFTFTLTTYEGDRQEAYYVYCTEFYHLSFVQTADGSLQVQGISQGDSPKTHRFDLVMRDGCIVLVDGDTVIRPLHRQGERAGESIGAGN